MPTIATIGIILVVSCLGYFGLIKGANLVSIISLGGALF